MHSRFLKSVSQVLSVALLTLAPVAAVAAQGSSAKKGQNSWQYLSRFDIFAGYSYLAPNGTVQVPQPYTPPPAPIPQTPTSYKGFAANAVPSQTGAPVVPYSYDAVDVGGLFSGAYFFNRHVGAQIEYAEHNWGTQSSNGSNIGTHGNNDGFQTLGGGLIARFPMSDHITPFVHGLVDLERVGGPDFNPYRWGPGLTVGGGMDIETPWMNHHLALRLFQADYEYMHANFGPGTYGGRANINAARLSTGIVFHIGSIAPPPPVTLACSANPESVYPGTPVAITATPGNLNPKYNVLYSWSGAGVSGKGTSATVNTSSLAPGSYTVHATVKEGKKGKEGLKPWQTASCAASFTVKAFEPPTISCSASPSTIKPGQTSTITSTAVSPQNLPLTYSYSASAGTVTGTGKTAVYSSTGAPTGAVGITCKVSDNKGHTASADTTVTIQAPPPPPQPHTQALCSISFTTYKWLPTRVDNQAKACLDQVAIDLQQHPNATAVMVGESSAKEKAITARREKYHARNPRVRVTHYAAQRAVNAKNYLVVSKGIDPSRIEVKTTDTEGQLVQNYLVPSGANFTKDVSGTTPVNESVIKPQKRYPLPVRHSSRHKKSTK